MDKVKIAVFTLEGIILDTRKAVQEFHKHNFGQELIIDTETFNVYDLASLTSNPVDFLGQFLETGQWNKMEVLPGAKDGLLKAKEKGYKVFIISQVEKHLTDSIEEYLKIHELSFDAFIAAGVSKGQANTGLRFYIDVLKPSLCAVSNLEATQGISGKGYGSVVFINPLEDHRYIKYTHSKTLNEYFEKHKK